MPNIDKVAAWEKWVLRGLLAGIAVAALGVWNDVHDMKSDLRAHVASEHEINGFQDRQLENQSVLIMATKDFIGDLSGRVKVAESKLGIH